MCSENTALISPFASDESNQCFDNSMLEKPDLEEVMENQVQINSKDKTNQMNVIYQFPEKSESDDSVQTEIKKILNMMLKDYSKMIGG